MTDAQAVLRCQDGDREAFHHLVERYQDLLYRTAMLMTGSRAPAEELVQGTLRAAWRGIHGFQHGCPFQPWLMRYLAREGVSQRRRPVAGVVPSGSGQPVDPDEGRHGRQEMRQALAGLDADQRHLLVLHYFADLTVSQLATALDAQEDTINARLGHALGHLRERLEAQGAQEVANDGS
ncbi:MAG: sigma-70 family RNA polymerase sigma factor [Chloroflexota bacterium]|nr:sigma-70 family RNA polymerase sigma factor [Chloroflexota bacterium]